MLNAVKDNAQCDGHLLKLTTINKAKNRGRQISLSFAIIAINNKNNK